MKDVKLNGLKLRKFETTFRKAGSREDVFKYLDSFLSDTRGRKFYAAICKDGENPERPRLIHTNPSDIVVCAEAIVRELSQNDKSKDNAVFQEDLAAWLEDVKRRSKDSESLIKGHRTQLNKCVKAGYMTKEGKLYKKAEGFSLEKFAFALGIIWAKDKIENGVYIKGKKGFPAKELEAYFNVERLSNLRNKVAKYKKTKILQKIYDSIII